MSRKPNKKRHKPSADDLFRLDEMRERLRHLALQGYSPTLFDVGEAARNIAAQARTELRGPAAHIREAHLDVEFHRVCKEVEAEERRVKFFALNYDDLQFLKACGILPRPGFRWTIMGQK